jgi:glyoxylase-like metal-dependent hydrolase (beta-lactamase superfamily II)
MKINTIEIGAFRMDGGGMFGVVPKVIWSRVYDQGDEKNRIPLQARLLYIEHQDRKILVDVGPGNKYNSKIRDIYDINLDRSNPDAYLSDLNLKRTDITDVIFTHLHFDHSGGATIIENGDIVPAFPNAKYYVQKDHYNYAIKPSLKDGASFFNENYVPLYENGMLELIDGDGELFPGISLITVNGHTKQMQLVKIEDNDQTFLYMADLIPTSAHIPVPYIMGFDNYPMTTLEEKQKWLPIIAENNWIAIFEHDNYNPAGKIIFNQEKHTYQLGEKFSF